MDTEIPLLVMVGAEIVLEEEQTSWIERIEALRKEALPMLAARAKPLPSLLLNTDFSEKYPSFFSFFQKGMPTPPYLPVWCSLLTSDLSVAETYLLLHVAPPLSQCIPLRFHLSRHREILESIDHYRQLFIYIDGTSEAMKLELDIPDLAFHLKQCTSLRRALHEQSDHKLLP